MLKVIIKTENDETYHYVSELGHLHYPDDCKTMEIVNMPNEYVEPPNITDYDPYNPDDMETALNWYLQFCPDAVELLHTASISYPEYLKLREQGKDFSAKDTPLRKTRNLIQFYENIFQYAEAYKDLSTQGRVYFSTRMLHDIDSLLGSELEPMDIVLNDWYNS